MRKVITYGSFDLFHKGHYRILERAKALGDYLIVGVTTEQYDEYRGKLNVVDSLMERIENVKKSGFADEIIIEDHAGQKLEDIQKYEVDVFAIGSDWRGKFDYLIPYCEVVYLERTKGISSTMLRSQKYSIVKMGVIGNGRIASRFISEAKFVSGTNLEGVYNPTMESAKRFAERFELNFYTNDLSVFFNKIDAVYIASPHGTHYQYIKQSLQNGKHVLCEKPIVLKEDQAMEMYQLAADKGLILLEGIKTAYVPGFTKLLSIAKSGCIGDIRDVEACFTKLADRPCRELDPMQHGGSLNELGSYPLMAIIKLLGTDYTDVSYASIWDENSVDIYTKIQVTYPTAMATAKVGLGVKSQGSLVIAGTKGYIYCESPWWKTQYFEVCYEDSSKNEKFFCKFEGEGLRYELSDFIFMIQGNKRKRIKLSSQESKGVIKIIEQHKQNR